jgi:hypothetical protein
MSAIECCAIRLKGCLDARWSAWFESLTVQLTIDHVGKRQRRNGE